MNVWTSNQTINTDTAVMLSVDTIYFFSSKAGKIWGQIYNNYKNTNVLQMIQKVIVYQLMQSSFSIKSWEGLKRRVARWIYCIAFSLTSNIPTFIPTIGNLRSTSNQKFFGQTQTKQRFDQILKSIPDHGKTWSIYSKGGENNRWVGVILVLW